MDYVFDEWKRLLQAFQSSVEKQVDEIHKQKAEIQQMKIEIFDRLESGLYYRDDERIVISAPEIIIGNVSKSGDLLDDCGKVVIKGSKVALDGVGPNGSIVSRAPSIRQQAVNPGIDGVEAVVCDHSEIISQATSISLESNKATGAFATVPVDPGKGGISIHADSHLSLQATASQTGYKDVLTKSITDSEKEYEALTKDMNKQRGAVDSLFLKMKNYFIENEDKVHAEDFKSRVELLDIEDIHAEMDKMLPQFYKAVSELFSTISLAAEANRKKKAFKEAKDALPADDAFLSTATGAHVDIVGENIKLLNHDGDGNLRTDFTAGIDMATPNMTINMSKPDGTLVDNSTFTVNSQNFYYTSSNPSKDGKNLTVVGSLLLQAKTMAIEAVDYAVNDGVPSPKSLTADGRVTIAAKTVNVDSTNPTNVESDDKGVPTKGEYKADGEVNIRSKAINMETLDYELADGKLKPKTLPAGSTINMRTEKMAAKTVDGEGKATGSISLDSKAVRLTSFDVNKETLEDDKTAADGYVYFHSHNVFGMGEEKIEMESGNQLLVSAGKVIEMRLDDESSMVQLMGGKLGLKGSTTTITGAATIGGNTEVKGKLTAPDGEFANVNATNSMTAPNMSDGIKKPGGAPGKTDMGTQVESKDMSKL